MSARDKVAFGSFNLDFHRRILTRNGEPVRLGGRAIDLLCALVQADGALLTKGELMATVWPKRVVEENNLAAQVSSLRRVLGRGQAGFIQTVPGRGYRFVPDASLRIDGLPPKPPIPAQEVRYLRTRDGFNLAVASSGEGPALVRAPVWMSHVEYDWRTSIWANFLQIVSQGHQLVRYDARGMGLSDRNPPRIGLDESVADLETVVDGLGLKTVSLLGISQGVPISIAYAVRHPDRVSHLVLAGGFARGARVGAPQSHARIEALTTLMRANWGSDNAAYRQLFTSLGFPEATPAQMEELNELQRRSTSAEMAAEVMWSVTGMDVSNLLPRVRAPTLVLHSRDDAWIPVERSRVVARGIPGARFVEVAGANHVVLPQEPEFSRYTSEIRRFLGTKTFPPGG